METIFYGVGVGPGDPELLTLKAVRVIRECEVIAVAVSAPDFAEPVFEEAGADTRFSGLLEKCAAYRIVLPAVPEVAGKARLFLPMPMMKEKEALRQIHDSCADAAEAVLTAGKKIAFITLGDPAVYSTCLYVHKRLKMRGCKTCLIPGVPSFCAAAARLDIGLAENREELHIIPASYGVEESLNMQGTKVLMKAGKKIPYVKQAVKEQGLEAEMVENCGMSNERIYRQVDQIPDDAGYYSLMVVKKNPAEAAK